MGWTFTWYSRFESDFNYDFQAMLDQDVTSAVYNFKQTDPPKKGDMPGLSVFFKEDRGLSYICKLCERFGEHSDYVQFVGYDPTRRQYGPYGPGSFNLHDEYETEELK